MRRRALLRTAGLAGVAGLTGLAGCAGVLDGDSPGESNDETVNPALEGTPTAVGDTAWSVAVPDVYALHGVDSAFVVSTLAETDGGTDSERVRYRAFDARSGIELWQTETLPRGGYVFEIDDVMLSVNATVPGQIDSSATVTAIDSQTGVILWHRGGVEFVDAVGETFVLAERGEDGDRSAFSAVERRTGRERWATPAARYFRLASDTVVTLRRESATPSPTVPPGATTTPTESETEVGTAVGTATGTAPATATQTPTDTPTDTATKAETETSTKTPTDTATASGTRTPTDTEARPYVLRGQFWTNGGVAWRVPVPESIENASAVATAEDRILFLEEFGGYVVVDTAAETVAATGSLPNELSGYATALRGSTAYVGDWTFGSGTGDPAYLSGIDLADGSSWTREFPGTAVRPVERPEVGDPWDAERSGEVPKLVYGNHIRDGVETVAHDPADGSVRWRREAVAVSLDGRGPIVTQPGAVVALDADGGERWRSGIPFEGRVTNGLGPADGGYAFRRGPILFLSTDDGLASYDTRDGTRRQSITSENLLDLDLTALTDRTVAFVRDGRLQAFEL